MADEKTIKELLGAMRWPPWMDAGYMLAASEFFVTPGLSTVAGGAPVIGGDARRWAIFFLSSSTFAGPGKISPWPRKDGEGFILAGTNQERSFTIFTHGAMVGSEWYLDTPVAGQTFTIASLRLS